MTNEEKIFRGERLADILDLEEVDNWHTEILYKTTWGTKSALRLYETVKRILEGA